MVESLKSDVKLCLERALGSSQSDSGIPFAVFALKPLYIFVLRLQTVSKVVVSGIHTTCHRALRRLGAWVNDRMADIDPS